jgi:RNA 2',3'-cyclic 3'-phosphodiesterase
MRLFIAIEIPGEIKQKMGELQSRLKKSGVDASWTRPEGIHLTLKFLGEVEETKVSEIINALLTLSKKTTGFHLEIAGAGAFPNAKNVRVVWVGVSGETNKLASLQTTVEDKAAELGFKRENREFNPHLTLGRIKYIRSREMWIQALDEIKNVRLAAFGVHTISLMKSDLKPSGAVYTEIGKVEL